MPRWWNGRHGGLKSPCPQGRESSTLSRGTYWQIVIRQWSFAKKANDKRLMTDR